MTSPQTTPQTLPQATPPHRADPLSRSGIPYLLFYRTGSNPNPQFFLFYHESSDMRRVMDRIKRHCELMNLKFVNVRPFIVDLDEAETRQYGQPQE
jgi:hypothetical protein